MNNNITYTAFVENIYKSTICKKRVYNEKDAIRFIKGHMRRKLGISYMSCIDKFHGNIVKGYRDKENKYHFYIVKFTRITDVKVKGESIFFEL